MLINPLYLLLAAILLFGGGGSTGWKLRGDHEAALQLEAKKDWDKKLAEEKARGDDLAVKLEAEKNNIKTITIESIREIPKVTTIYVEKPGEAAKTIPPAVIVWGAVRLFNRTLRPDLPITASELAYPAGTTDITRATVDFPDVLNVHTENAGKYAECRAQLNKLIDWEVGQKPSVAAD